MNTVNRRQFLKTTSVLVGGLVIAPGAVLGQSSFGQQTTQNIFGAGGYLQPGAYGAGYYGRGYFGNAYYGFGYFTAVYYGAGYLRQFYATGY